MAEVVGVQTGAYVRDTTEYLPSTATAMRPELLVATDVDFSLLRGVRPVAAGEWDDVQRAEIEREGLRYTLRLLLRNGRTFTAHDDAPGWDDLVEHAEDMLPDFPSWRDLQARADATAGAVTVFSR